MSRFYTQPALSVNGEVAEAAELNNVNIGTDTGFILVAAEIDAQLASGAAQIELARKWAEELENVPVTPGAFSAFHWATKAVASAAAAAISAGAALASQNAAAASASTATTQAGISTTQAGISTTQAGIATTKAGISTTQAGISTTQAGIATTKASEASVSASNASTSATNSANSALASANSATTATTQAGISTTQASNAATSATNASNSASAAATSASDALDSETATAALYDSFDDRYLGAKATEPLTDNDGNALITGALFFDSTADRMKVYDGSTWVRVDPANAVTLTGNQTVSDIKTFSISPVVPTLGATDISTKVASTAYVKSQVASKTLRGMVELATPIEVLAGTDDIRAVTSAGLTSKILGTVSQSGGVPTGAIIERGSNANGEYVKFADGTLICTMVYTGGFAAAPHDSVVLALPINMINNSYGVYPSVTPSQDIYPVTTTWPQSTTTIGVRSTLNHTQPVVFVAIGRWF